jgi:MarR family transcriptional regulator, transcriptional regulator for hemolysin
MAPDLRFPAPLLKRAVKRAGSDSVEKSHFALEISFASTDNVSMLMDAQDSIAFLLHDLARQFRYRFDARARALGVTRPQWRALLILARREGLSQSELADLLEVERITLCRMVDRLAEAGLVERRADPKDRRIWRLHLTPSALGIVEQLTQIGADLEEEALSALSAAERTMLRETLTRVRNELYGHGRQDRNRRGSIGDQA